LLLIESIVAEIVPLLRFLLGKSGSAMVFFCSQVLVCRQTVWCFNSVAWSFHAFWFTPNSISC